MSEPEKFETSQEPVAPDRTASLQATTGPTPPVGETDGEYRLVDDEPVAATPPQSHAEDAGATQSTFQPAGGVADEGQTVDEFAGDVPTVSEVWSRWTEWKEPLLWSAASIGLVCLVQFGGAWVSGLLVFLGLAYGTYHIVISLEIPVRVTPEQAVQEFYAALGHRLPNYRRMYSLLTADAKRPDNFPDFPGFRSYWKKRVTRFSRSYEWLTPLDFRVEGFKCRYNPERTLANVRYKLQVFARSRTVSGEPIAEFDLRNLLAKGPDSQWYLNDGTLPEPS